MSATDARKLLAASRKSRRITSPYASYSLAGALFCNICSNTPIKSESLWDAHVASAQHKSNVARRGGTVSSGKSSSSGSNKRPAESSSGDLRKSTTGGQVASKRLKTAKADVKNLALPVGFFDDDDDEDEEGIVSTGEVIELDDETPTPPEEGTINQQPPTTSPPPPAASKLPADFFSTTSASKPKEDELDDEWAAFQADIADAEKEIEQPNITLPPISNHTISAPALTAAQIQQQGEESPSSMNARNARTIAEEEMEDARAAMAEFFDEQSSLEERVARLKERREMLRQASMAPPAGVPPPPSQSLHRSNSVKSVTMGGMDDSNPVPELQSEGSDDDYEDDDEMFLRRR